jgi:hypothetical protein
MQGTQSQRCEYCGAYLTIESGSFAPKAKSTCPECHKEIPEGSRLCMNCGRILTENEVDIKKLRYLQNTEKMKQEKWRSMIPSAISGNIETDEYVFFVLPVPGGFFSGSTCWVVTENKVMKYEKGQLREILIKDIASVDVLDPERSAWLGDVTMGSLLQTYDMKQLTFTLKIHSATDSTTADTIIEFLELFTKMVETSRFLCETKIAGITSFYRLKLH